MRVSCSVMAILCMNSGEEVNSRVFLKNFIEARKFSIPVSQRLIVDKV